MIELRWIRSNPSFLVLISCESSLSPLPPSLLTQTTTSEFVLTHDHPIQMTHSQLTTLASRWPSLEVLNLACEPIKLTDTSSLTLGAFVPFARYCPGMRELALFVNAGADVDVGVEREVGEGMGEVGFLPRFKNLTKLSVGVSDIRDENAVALFLSRLCPLGVEIEYGVTWHVDLEEWVTELQDEEDGMHANVLTPTNTNNTTNNNNNVTGNNVTTTAVTTLPQPSPPFPLPHLYQHPHSHPQAQQPRP